MSMLKVEVIGNIGNDAVVKEKDGKKYTSFSVAHSEKKGEQETTLWVGCFLNGDGLASYLKKGKQVFVRGNLTLGVYEGNANASCSVTEIQLLGKKE